MTLSQPQHFDDFKKVVKDWMPEYRYASLSSLAVKTKEGTALLFGRIIFEFGKPEGGQEFHLETADLVAKRVNLQVSKDTTDLIFSEFLLGKISLGEDRYSKLLRATQVWLFINGGSLIRRRAST